MDKIPPERKHSLGSHSASELVPALGIHILIELGISVDFLETTSYSKNSGVIGAGFVALAELEAPNDSASVPEIPEEANSS